MTKHKWYLPLAAAVVTAFSLTGVSLADDRRSDASVSATAQSSASHHKAKRAAGRARASALGGVNVKRVPERFSLHPGEYIDWTATCPGGTSAVGGGFDGTGDDTWTALTLLDSFPNSRNGWTVRVHNAGKVKATEVYVVVTCAS